MYMLVDLIRNMEVELGDHRCQYPRRKQKRFSGKISANPITAKILLEGPISKFSEGGASASYILSYKTSYLNHTAPNCIIMAMPSEDCHTVLMTCMENIAT